MGWLKDKLVGSRQVSRPAGGVCDSCNGELDPAAAGYYVTTRDVVLSEGYWASTFATLKPIQDVFDMGEPQRLQMFQHMVEQSAGQGSAWSICETCSELFIFDRDKARSNAVHNIQPADSGRVDPSGCVLFAACGWERVFGRWPETVEQPAVVDSCDLCRKTVYEGEFNSFIPQAKMERFRAEGVIDNDPVRQPRQSGDDTGWAICQPCMARLFARSHRADHP